jgi:hypothetical protein
MNDPGITIRFDGNRQVYRPGETLTGQYVLERVAAAALKAIEVSVLWYTEGKGDEDLAVHEFWRRSVENEELLDPAPPARFSTTLPRSPLSYDGVILKLHWCVRVRAFLQGGKEVVGQKAFQLGNIPSVGDEVALRGHREGIRVSSRAMGGCGISAHPPSPAGRAAEVPPS